MNHFTPDLGIPPDSIRSGSALSFSTSAEQKIETIQILEGVIDAISRRDGPAAQEQYIHYLSRAQNTVIEIIESNTEVDTGWPAVS